MTELVLCTLNARHAHASMGLRCLRANLGGLRDRSCLMEFVIGTPAEDMAERLLALAPRVIGFGVYIWNVTETTRLVALLRRIAPQVRVVLGGPEVSHETESQSIVAMADHVITGAGEHAFAQLARALLDGPRPLMKVIPGGSPAPDTLALPYDEYTEADLAHRHLYLEASRGCPFRCEFCLSALDRTATPFELPRVLQALDALYRRGARRFRFVDRTFNLKAQTSAQILGFFLDRLAEAPDDPVFAHFELVPDHLPSALREPISRFPAGTLQFEIGIQTWNPAVQSLISRRQDNDRAEANLAWLREHTQAHLHVDLIAGLPGEDWASFGEGFDRLVALRPHEIQVGILKRLRGAPIARHEATHDLRFNPEPPYNVVSTDRLGFVELQRLTRFARYWDLIANGGRFPRTLPLILGDVPFARFMRLCDWLHANGDATHRLSLERRFERVRDWLLTPEAGVDAAVVEACLRDDYRHCGAQGRPAFLERGLAARAAPAPTLHHVPDRQARHLT